MARKSGGRLNKLLNFIGLVDEDVSQNNEDFVTERQSYGRGSTYSPAASRNSYAQRRTAGEARGVDVRRSPLSSTAQRRRAAEAALEDDPALQSRTPVRAPSRYDFSNRGPYGQGGRTARASRYGEEEISPEPAQPPMVRENRPVNPPQQRMVMLSMQRLEDCCDVIDHLINGNMVLVTLEDLDVKLHQRARDTLSGAVYALNAKIRKASERTYLLMPGTVDVDDAEYIVRSF